ncbi:hypothetical protein K474DRAFT_1669948 [Panus rudis PR-1116 ss-1]|nr:hypothetical protein K474DRAFT_1669948 [Panus rudis PR-1116 ss-1]
MKIARAKLVGTQDLYRRLGTLPEERQQRAALALLDIRVMLSFEPTRKLIDGLQGELVASHMRIVHSIPTH